jgi:hypothetical protein
LPKSTALTIDEATLFHALSLIAVPSILLAQQSDTLATKQLDEIIINGEFYPGPGVWSSDGRSLVVTLGFKV